MKTKLRFLCGWTVPIALLSSSLCLAQILPSNRTTTQNLSTRQVQADYGKLPLTFEANQGQIQRNVKFVARGAGYTVFLTSGQMVLALRSSSVTSNANTNVSVGAPNQKNAIPATNLASASLNQKTEPTVIQINLVGADENPATAGEDPQPGKVNYFIGNDPKKWQTNVPTYKQVRYKNLYPGIDLVYYGNQSRVEHDFVISPGADPNQIQLDVKGTDHLSVASNGDLILSKGNDEIRLQAPVLYQEFRGMRIPVTGQYSVRNSTRVFFKVGQYDKTRPLVIDPVLVYSTFLGGSGDDQGVGIGVDSAGNTYITGCTSSTDFPLASQNGPPPSGENAFVAKLDASASALVYADYIGGSSYDCSSALTLDNSNDIFITGNTYSADFPTVNPYQATNNSNAAAAFVTEVSPDGSSLIYSTYLSGSTYAQANAIGLDSLGDMYVAGWTTATDFPTLNAYQPVVSPNQGNEYGGYSFLTEFATGGASLVYSTYYAGSTNAAQGCGSCYPSPYSFITGMAVDPSGNAYVAGVTNTYDFPTTAGAYQTTNSTSDNTAVGFIGTFNSSGSPVYSTYYGAGTTSPTYEGLYPSAIAFDLNGSAYVVGTDDGANAIPITTPNLCDPSQTVCDSGFISKFDPTGTTVLYSTYLSPTIDAEPESVLVDANGDAYVYSQSFGGPADALVNPIESYTNGEDVFLQEIDPTGGTVLFSTFMGGSGDDYPGGLALDFSGNIYISGFTDSSDYPVTAGVEQNTYPGGTYDAFVSKIGPDTAPAVSLSPSSIQFPDTPVGTASAASTSLLRNMGSAPLTISNITVTGDFSETNNCSSGVASASNCTFRVTFTPTQSGPRFGSITIADNAAGSPHVISLAGNGVAPDFSMPASGGSSTVSPGGVGTYQFSISPVGGTFSSPISLSCANLPPFSTCTITPSSVTLGANSASVTVSIKTAGNSAQMFTPGTTSHPLFAALSLSSGLGLFGMFLFGARLDRKRASGCLLTLAVIAATLLLASCGAIAPASRTGSSTPAGTYTVTVIGTSGNIQHSTSLSLTVE